MSEVKRYWVPNGTLSDQSGWHQDDNEVVQACAYDAALAREVDCRNALRVANHNNKTLAEREASLRQELAEVKHSRHKFREERDAALGREAALQTSLNAVTLNLNKTDKALLDLQNSEFALREELAKLRRWEAMVRDSSLLLSQRDALQQRLTAAEQRSDQLEKLLREERLLHYGDETEQETKSRLFGHFGDGA